LVICNTLEMITGRGLLGPAPPSGPLNVGYWNVEDPDEEVERRIAATCLRHDVDPASLRGKLFLGSRLTEKRRIASLDPSGNVVFDTAMLGEIERLIAELKLDCVIFDPLIAFHRVPENDNAAMEQIIKDGFGDMAARCDICIELSQHTRKSTQGRQGDLTADDSRGAGAIVNAARSVRVLNRMTEDEALLPKITPEERRHHLRISRDKTNLAPPGKATWIHLLSVELPNGDDPQHGDDPQLGDFVQAAESWDYPQAFAGVTADAMRWARDEVQRKAYRTSSRSPDWFGHALAAHLDLKIGDPDSLEQKGNRKRILAIISTWVANGVLVKEKRRDEGERKDFEYFTPGNWDEAEIDG
jgi:hypothetical protein